MLSAQSENDGADFRDTSTMKRVEYLERPSEDGVHVDAYHRCTVCEVEMAVRLGEWTGIQWRDALVAFEGEHARTCARGMEGEGSRG